MKTVFDKMQEAESRFSNAKRDNIKQMLELFPIGSIWLCNHGSRNGGSYWVEVLEANYPNTLFVQNVVTGARKSVYWRSLEAPDA